MSADAPLPPSADHPPSSAPPPPSDPTDPSGPSDPSESTAASHPSAASVGALAAGAAPQAVPAAAGAPPRSPWAVLRPRLVRALGVLAVVVAGASVGAALAPEVPARIGPIEARLRVVPSLAPGVQLLVPPAGQIEFDTHWAPVSVQARIAEVDLEGARSLIDSSRGLQELQATAPDTLRRATLQAAATTATCSLGGAVVLSVLVYRRRWRRTAQVAAAMTGVLVGTAGGLVATFDSDRLAQPRFTGLLSQAPYVAGQASSLVRRLESYRTGLADIVQGVTTLYATSGRLPVLPGGGSEDVVTVLHISDIHLNPIAFDLTDKLVEQFDVDLVLDTGDITSWGTEVESGTLARVGQVKVPYVFVRGNHDSLRTQQAVGSYPNAVVLDGRVAEVAGLVIAGIGDPRFTPETVGPPLAAASGPTPANVPSIPSPAAATPGTSSSGSPSGSPSGSSGSPSAAPSRSGAVPTAPSGSPSGARTPGASGSPVPTTRGAAGAGAGDQAQSPDPEIRAGARLARVIAEWNAENPDKPVAVAAVHEPYAVPPLLGTVPLVLAGHFHRRDVRLDPSGTRVMIQGSTGGAGLSAAGVDRLAEGEPVPLAATLLYVARSGERAGQVLAYDEITVGGFGLASVALDRTVVRPDEPVLAPGAVDPGPSVPAAPPGTTVPAGTSVPATSAAARPGG